jgi:hypothetical protein
MALSPVSAADKPRLCVGGEIEYRNYDVNFSSGSLRGVLKHHFLRGEVAPYLGAGPGFDTTSSPQARRSATSKGAAMISSRSVNVAWASGCWDWQGWRSPSVHESR